MCEAGSASAFPAEPLIRATATQPEHAYIVNSLAFSPSRGIAGDLIH